MDTGYSKWRKLDNAALAFPLVTGKERYQSLSVLLSAKGRRLTGKSCKAALDQAMEKYPLFQAVLRKGLFWFYLEHRESESRGKAGDRAAMQPFVYSG